MRYFENCTTLDEAKKQYRKLAIELHPDTSKRDSAKEFIEMQSQFEKFKPKTEKFKGEEESHNAQFFMTIIDDLMKIALIEFELCGSFIWISGNTKAAKEEIKAVKNELFKPAMWHSKKLMWFFSPSNYKRTGGKELSIEEIRNKYGSETFKAKTQTALAA